MLHHHSSYIFIILCTISHIYNLRLYCVLSLFKIFLSLEYFMQIFQSSPVIIMVDVLPFCSHAAIVVRHKKQHLALHSCKALVRAVEKVAVGQLSLYPFTVRDQLVVFNHSSSLSLLLICHCACCTLMSPPCTYCTLMSTSLFLFYPVSFISLHWAWHFHMPHLEYEAAQQEFHVYLTLRGTGQFWQGRGSGCALAGT